MEKYCELKENCLMVYMPKELGHHEANQLKMEADLMIEAYHVKQLVFDFANTEFMDSSGIGVVIGRCRNMGYYGGKVYAQNLNGRLKKIFMVSGLHKLVGTSLPDIEGSQKGVEKL